MNVYVVIVMERHQGPDVELFTDQAEAVARGREIAEEYAHGLDDIEEPEDFYGHLYYADWGSEGDHVFVESREIKGAQ